MKNYTSYTNDYDIPKKKDVDAKITDPKKEGVIVNEKNSDGKIEAVTKEIQEVELVELAAVATSGSYNDLSNKPTIPKAITDKIIVGTSATATTNGAVSGTGGVYLNHIDSQKTAPQSSHKIVGSGVTTVKSDVNGNITIHSPQAPVTSVNNKTGPVSLTANDVGAMPLITVSVSDNGKFLRVVNGAWDVAKVPSANGVNF